ncbi:MAG: monophosphatase [Actinomycetota bacterium]|nr:monophosphatase [Actinomycetota bacterium]
MTDDRLLAVLNAVTAAVHDALADLDDWGPAGTRAGQYFSDLAADEVAVAMLVNAGLGVLSEETGVHHPDRDVVVALDPVDGSTNASRKLPWYATSLAAVDGAGLRAAVVVNQATGDRFEAVRGAGATCNGRPLSTTGCTTMADAIVGLNGWPSAHLGWRQFRALGSAALDICAVGRGQLDAYIDCSDHAQAPWDYLGGVLVCQEAGGLVVDAAGGDLVSLGFHDRRAPVAAASEKLLAEALEARAGLR